MFIVGHGLYGRCDFFLNLFVATRFFTVFFVPLIPIESFVVLSEQGDKFNGIKIPISGKSLLIAWLRAALWVPAVICIGAGFLHSYYKIADDNGTWLEIGKYFGGGLLLAATCVGSLAIGMRASFRRAVQLGMAAGVSPAKIAESYGQPVPDEATLAQLVAALRPKDATGKATLGPVGRTILFLLLLWIGGLMLFFGGRSILNEGYRGWNRVPDSIFWFCLGCVLAMNAILVVIKRKGPKLLYVAIGFLIRLVIVGVAGPYVSTRYWMGVEERQWDEYLAQFGNDEMPTKSTDFLGYRLPDELLRPEYFLLETIKQGKLPLELKYGAAKHDDPKLRQVVELGQSYEADSKQTGPAKVENRRKLYAKVIPVIKSGQWPDSLEP